MTMAKQIRKDAELRAIAARLRKMREESGKFQKDVARETGMNMGDIEAARYNISVTTLDRLCRYYGTTMAEFFEGLGL